MALPGGIENMSHGNRDWLSWKQRREKRGSAFGRILRLFHRGSSSQCHRVRERDQPLHSVKADDEAQERKSYREVGPSRKVIGDEGNVKRRIERLYRPEVVKEPPSLEDLERYKRYFERSRKQHE